MPTVVLQQEQLIGTVNTEAGALKSKREEVKKQQNTRKETQRDEENIYSWRLEKIHLFRLSKRTCTETDHMFTHFNNDSLFLLISAPTGGRFTLCYSYLQLGKFLNEELSSVWLKDT